MLRDALAALALSLVLLGALGARALPAIEDGTSNTIVLPEVPPDPEVAEPPAPALSHELAGSAKLKGVGFKATQPYTLQMSFDTGALTFLAMDAGGALYSGHLVPKGTQGTRFKLFLDGPSGDELAADVAARGASASGLPAGAVLGESSGLTLKLNEDGSVSLKVKSEVLMDGLGEVVFKVNLSAAASN